MHSLFNPALRVDNFSLPLAGNVECKNSKAKEITCNLNSLRYKSSRLKLANESRPKNCNHLSKKYSK